MTMIGNKEALQYVECGIPDMLGDLDPETAEYYEYFTNRIRYLIKQDIGVKPKYHKGIYSAKRDYWTCGNCGRIVRCDIGSNYCDNCGYHILWDDPACLTGVKDEV